LVVAPAGRTRFVLRSVVTRGLCAALVTALFVGVGASAAAVPPPPNPSDQQLEDSQTDALASAAEVGRLSGLVTKTEGDIKRLHDNLELKGELVKKAMIDQGLAEADATDAEAVAVTAGRNAEAAGTAISQAKSKAAAFASASFRQGSVLGSMTALMDAASASDLLARQQMLAQVSKSQLDVIAKLQTTLSDKANLDSDAKVARDKATGARAAAVQSAKDATTAKQVAGDAFVAGKAQLATLGSQLDQQENDYQLARSKVANLKDQRAQYNEWLAAKKAEEERLRLEAIARAKAAAAAKLAAEQAAAKAAAEQAAAQARAASAERARMLAVAQATAKAAAEKAAADKAAALQAARIAKQRFDNEQAQLRAAAAARQAAATQRAAQQAAAAQREAQQVAAAQREAQQAAAAQRVAQQAAAADQRAAQQAARDAADASKPQPRPAAPAAPQPAAPQPAAPQPAAPQPAAPQPAAPQPAAPQAAAPAPAAPRPASPAAAAPVQVYYASCASAVAAGVAPIPKGSPGYRRALDSNGNGIACEFLKNAPASGSSNSGGSSSDNSSSGGGNSGNSSSGNSSSGGSSSDNSSSGGGNSGNSSSGNSSSGGSSSDNSSSGGSNSGADASPPPSSSSGSGQWSAAKGRAAVAAAEQWVGTPYSWGGGTSSGPSTGICGPNGAENDCNIVGFDCSGLTSYGWAQQGIAIPNYSVYQYTLGQHISESDLMPGDLMFYANDTSDPSTIHHVSMYAGSGMMVEAPYSGAYVQIVSAELGNGYIGATRIGT